MTVINMEIKAVRSDCGFGWLKFYGDSPYGDLR
jgi:hypothetical protein